MAWNSSPGWTYTQTNLSDKFHELGTPGKYIDAQTVAAGTQFDATGSNYGYGAVLIGTTANVTATKIHCGSSVIDGDDLLIGTIYEIGITKVIANTGNVFVFKRQQ